MNKNNAKRGRATGAHLPCVVSIAILKCVMILSFNWSYYEYRHRGSTSLNVRESRTLINYNDPTKNERRHCRRRASYPRCSCILHWRTLKFWNCREVILKPHVRLAQLSWVSAGNHECGVACDVGFWKFEHYVGRASCFKVRGAWGIKFFSETYVSQPIVWCCTCLCVGTLKNSIA